MVLIYRLIIFVFFLILANSIHVFDIKRAQKRDALLPLTGGISDGFYIVTMGLGTPEQTVRLTIDTGSSNLALISEGCMYSGKPCTANHTFSPQESSTSSNDTCKYLTQCSSCNTSSTCDFEISYADGTNVKGKMLKDVITFANKSSEIYFGAITTDTRGNFASNITDGILGLAQDSIDTNHLPSFMSQISKNMNLRNMFSICMGYQGGSFILGGIDDYYHVGDIMYTPIFSDRYNTVKMPKIQIANYENSLNIPTANYYTYVDTGTTQVIVPADVMKSITNNFERLCEDSVLSPFICGKQNIFNYDPSPCFKFNKNIFSRLPDIKFQFQGMESNSVFEVSISPKNYILYIPSPDPDYDYCGKFGITSMDGVSVVILGDIFMKSLYVVFDYDNSKIGLAYSKNCGGTVQTSTSNPIAMVGIFLSLFVFFMGAAVMAFIVYFKTRSERYQRVNLNAL